MSNFLFLAGSRMNKFGRGQSTGIYPAVHAVSSVANAYDNDPSTPVIFGSVAADSYLTTNVNALANAGFETAFPSGWTDGSSGGGTFTRTTAGGEFVSGVAGANFNPGAGTSYAYQDIVVSAGEWRQMSVTLKNNGAATPYHIIGNLKTGNYWTGSAWAAGFQGVVIADTGSFVAYTQTYQVESVEVCMSDTVTLRIGVLLTTGVNCYVDNVYDVPGLSFAGVFGHNLGPVVTGGVTTLYRSTDYGMTYGTLVSSMTIKRPSYFSTFTMAYSPDWKFLIPGTPHEAPWFGEIVLGQYQTSVAKPRWDPVVDREFPGSRQTGTAGRQTAYSYARDARESIGMSFLAENATAERSLYDQMWLRSEQGRYPTIIVPRDDETAVYYGHLVQPYSSSRPFGDARPTSLYLSGAALPTVGL